MNTQTTHSDRVAEVVAEYERQVRGNNSEEWNTIEAVAFSDTGEILWEVEEVIADIGMFEFVDAEWRELSTAVEELQAKFRAELS